MSKDFPNQRLYERFTHLRRKLDELVVAQDEAKDWLAIAAAEHELQEQRSEGHPRVVLLVGSTGSGKTELARALATTLSVPFCRIDASALSHTSFQGLQLTDIHRELLRDLTSKLASPDSGHSRNRDTITAIQRGVVMVDELDKIAFVQESRATSTQERHFEAVQTTLLPLFEGKTILISDGDGGTEFNTSKLLLLAAGSFSNPEIAKIIRERETKSMSASEGHWGFIRHEDLIRFGFLPEIVGRIKSIVPLQKLKATQYSDILTRSIRQDASKVLGCRLVFEAGVLELLARRVGELNLGARAVGIVLEKVKVHIYSRAEDIKIDPHAAEIVLTLKYAERYWPDSF